MINRDDNPLWERLDTLCWEGYSRVISYAEPGSIRELMGEYEGREDDWCTLIDNITNNTR